MTNEEKERFLRALELPPGSGMDEVERAYWRLKDLFTQNSLALFPIEADMAPEDKSKILAEIVEAYHRLKEYFLSPSAAPVSAEKPAPPARPDAAKRKTASDLGDALSQFTEIGGRELKAVREMLDMSLIEVAAQTKIYIKHLQNIEAENYNALPALVYLKGYLTIYASYLGLDPAKVASDFLKKHSEHQAKNK